MQRATRTCWRVPTRISVDRKQGNGLASSLSGNFGFSYSLASFSLSSSSSSLSSSVGGSPQANPRKQDDDDLVITGISGRFPDSDNMAELKDNLFSKRDMVSAPTRFHYRDIPKHYGYMKNLDKFDAQFFAIPPKLAYYMDPQHRMILEVAFEAIIDAGINPKVLRGSSTAVYIGAAGNETLDFWQSRLPMLGMEGYGIVSASFVLPNRISYLMDLKGPSMAISSGCSATLAALEAAVHAIRSDCAEAAIVGGSVAHLSPTITTDFWQMGSLAKDGKSKSFDARGDGYARAETVSVMLIQKRKDAKRVYATIKEVRSNADGYKAGGFTFPNSQSQEALLRRLYADAGVDPGQVKYVEAHGTGTPAGDPEEILALANVFCKNETRKEPLLIGSVKSNLGHSESAAGMNGLSKVIIGIQERNIPPNLHFEKPRQEHEPLFSGEKALKVVTETTPFHGGYIGINSFGIGGSNVHLLLHTEETAPPQEPPATSNGPKDLQIPIILPFSGRTEAGVRESLQQASRLGSNDPNFVGLVHNIFGTNISGNRVRGFAMLTPGKEEPKVEINTLPFAFDRRPVCFVFPGMGSQWNEMGKDMRRLDVFRESLRKSTVVLKNCGVDLDELLKPNNPSIFNNGRNAVVAIAAVQLALYDSILSVGLKPDIFLGHSFGEIMCGYADGTFTAEETILVADARGRSFQESVDSSGIVGGMAAVGMSWEDISQKCPPNIYPACKNSADSVTISGEVGAIKDFVKVLEGQGVFAKEVNSCGCAAHSKFVHGAADNFEKYMREFFPKEKEQLRSERWISSSIPEKDWGTPLAKYNSAAYHANNVRSPVLFHEAVQKIPKDAAVIEIAPKGLFQAVLRGSLSQENFLVAPMTSGGKGSKEDDKLPHFISSLGKIYNAGVDVHMSKLYPSVSFPVPATTPGLGSLIAWNHEDSWMVPCVDNPAADSSGGMTVNVDLTKYEDQFLMGHKLGDRTVYPATGYLYLAWLGMSRHFGVVLEELPVILENVTFRRATFLKDKALDFRFMVSHASGYFEIKQDGAIVASGTIKKIEDAEAQAKTMDWSLEKNNNPSVNLIRETSKNSDGQSQGFLTTDDVYKELRLRGYNYSGDFQGIQRIDINGERAEVAWNGNYISFLDTILQTVAAGAAGMARMTAVPVRLQQVIINPIQLHKYLNEERERQKSFAENESENVETAQAATSSVLSVPVKINSFTKTISCPGVEFQEMTASVISQKRQDKFLNFEEYKFSPYFDDLIQTRNAELSNKEHKVDIEQLAKITGAAEIIDLVVENLPGKNVKVMDVFRSSTNSLTEAISKTAASRPNYKFSIKIVSSPDEMSKLDEKILAMGTQQPEESLTEKFALDPSVDLIFLDQTVYSPEYLQVLSSLKDNAFLVMHSAYGEELEGDFENFVKISHKFPSPDSNFALQLFKKKPATPVLGNTTMHSLALEGDSFEWLPTLQSLMKDAAEDTKSQSRIYLTSQNDPSSGILGLVKCLKMEEGGDKIRCIFDPEGHLTLNFQNPDSTLAEILEKDLVVNVLEGGKLGSFRHFPVTQASNVPTKQVEHAYVTTLTKGDLTSFRWIESDLQYHEATAKAGLTPTENQGMNLYKVHYAALNFKDIMLATGQLPIDLESKFTDASFGFEFSGVDSKGNRVMGMKDTKALATSVLADPKMVWKVPDHWSLEEAATTLAVYLTVYYAYYRGRLRPKQSILIHSGTGGIGQSAINVALAYDCEIYTTVGTEEKRKFIKEIFPSLKDENIGCSRDCSFEKLIKLQTRGRGVDVVLNSLADDKLQASVRCLAPGGKFLEIGKVDGAMNSALGMSWILKNIEMHGIDATMMLQDEIAIKETSQAFLEGIRNGVVKPLSRTVFGADQLEEAFRFMAGGKHMGKVLIKLRDEKEDSMQAPIKVLAMPRTYFLPDKAYVIVGGLGGLGLEVANWMVERGAKHLVLTSRSGVTTGYQALCLKKWRENGVTVDTPQIDLSKYEAARHFVHDLAEGRRIGGIFNSGMVLQDDVLQNLTKENFEAVAAPKVRVTANLDKLTQEYCPDLDYFVVFSSIACGKGNGAQSNYGYANSMMERVCENRRKSGQHGLAIQWGVIGDVGYVAEKIASSKTGGGSEMNLGGYAPQTIQSCLDVLDVALNKSCPVYSSVVVADNAGNKDGLGGILATFSSALGIKDLSSVPVTTKLVDLGMDSLIGVEVRQTLERDYDISLTAPEVRKLTFGNLLAIDAGTFKKTDVQDDSKTTVKPLWPQETLVKLTTKASNQVNSAAADVPILFVLPGADGSAHTMEPLAAALENVDCYGFQLTQNTLTMTSIKDMATQYIQEMKLIKPEGPYNIAAFSSGGVVAFEMIRKLEEEHKEKVPNFAVVDGFVNMEEQEMDHAWFTQQLLSALDPELAKSKELLEKASAGDSSEDRDETIIKILQARYPNEKLEEIKNFAETRRSYFYELASQRTTYKYGGNTTLVKASETATTTAYTDPTYKLKRNCEGPLKVHTVEGSHTSILNPPKVEEVASILNGVQFA